MLIRFIYSFFHTASYAVPLWLLLLPVAVFAQGGPGAHIGAVSGLPQEDLATLIGRIIEAGLALVGVIALAFFIYGGFIYITSGGDEKQIARGKQVMIYAMLGIVAIGLSYAVVNFVISSLEGGEGVIGT